MGIHKTFNRGQIIFKQGQKDVDGMWLISHGEFEVKMNLNNDKEPI